MQQVAMMLAGMMPKEELVKNLREAAEEYLLVPTKDNWEKLIIYSVLVTSRNVIDDNGGGINGVMKTDAEFDQMNKAKEFFNPKKN